MTVEEQRADRDVDALYGGMRAHHGGASARANGYRLQGWFTAEQGMVLAAVRATEGLVVDIGCGSGLMVQPLLADGRSVLGIDFNHDACRQARANGVDVARGDAFALPLADDSVGCVVNCQFLNQQSKPRAARLVAEIGRVLAPGGRAVLVWRNGTALVHRLALGAFRILDTLTGRPAFPYVDHSVAELAGHAAGAGLRVLQGATVFPPFDWRFADERGAAARVLGASGLLVLARQSTGGDHSRAASN